MQPSDISAIIGNPRVGIAPVPIVIGLLLKRNKSIPNNWIPPLAVMLGILLGVVMYGPEIGWSGSAVVCCLYGATAIGLHFDTKKLFQDKGSSA